LGSIPKKSTKLSSTNDSISLQIGDDSQENPTTLKDAIRSSAAIAAALVLLGNQAY